MNLNRAAKERFLTIAGFSLLFTYILSFLFEGQILYSLLDHFGLDAEKYVLTSILAHFAGLFSCGFIVKTPRMIKRVMIGGILVCMIATLTFFYPPSVLWLVCLLLAGYAAGCAVAAWGYFLKTYTPKNQRIKSCADVLIISNVIMIAINILAMNGAPLVGLMLSEICLFIGALLTWLVPAQAETTGTDCVMQKLSGNLKKPMWVLFLFIAVITVNSGLMYQVINPAYEHLTGIVSWYWAVPYIIALAIMRNLPHKSKRSLFLYIGMGMIVSAFIMFMLLGRSTADYLIVDTLMLGACGIFDLFWWSIIGEMLDYAKNPVKVFGIGLSANVFGILCGDVLGVGITSIGVTGAQVTVIALTVVCVTLVILPPLNRQLVMLLKSHAYLATYDHMTGMQQREAINSIKPLDPLTEREREVLRLILSGKSNKTIAEALFISESTVKTHAHNIYSKYDVGSRAELISILLKNH